MNARYQIDPQRAVFIDDLQRNMTRHRQPDCTAFISPARSNCEPICESSGCR